MLDAAEECRHKSLDLAKELLSAAFGRPLPEPGKVVQVRTLVRKQVNLAFLYTLLKSPGSIFVSVNFDSVIVYMKDIQFILVSLVSVFLFHGISKLFGWFQDENWDTGTILLSRPEDFRVDNVRIDRTCQCHSHIPVDSDSSKPYIWEVL